MFNLILPASPSFQLPLLFRLSSQTLLRPLCWLLAFFSIALGIPPSYSQEVHVHQTLSHSQTFFIPNGSVITDESSRSSWIQFQLASHSETITRILGHRQQFSQQQRNTVHGCAKQPYEFMLRFSKSLSPHSYEWRTRLLQNLGVVSPLIFQIELNLDCTRDLPVPSLSEIHYSASLRAPIHWKVGTWEDLITERPFQVIVLPYQASPFLNMSSHLIQSVLTQCLQQLYGQGSVTFQQKSEFDFSSTPSSARTSDEQGFDTPNSHAPIILERTAQNPGQVTLKTAPITTHFATQYEP